MIIYTLTRPTVGSRHCVRCGTCLWILPGELGGIGPKDSMPKPIPDQEFEVELYEKNIEQIQLALRKCHLEVLQLEVIT